MPKITVVIQILCNSESKYSVTEYEMNGNLREKMPLQWGIEPATEAETGFFPVYRGRGFSGILIKKCNPKLELHRKYS